MNTRAGDIFWLVQQIHRSKKYSEENTVNNNVQNFTNNNTSSVQRVNVSGKRGTGGWI